MNNAWRAQAVFVIVSVFAVVGCDSTQPDRIQTRTASVSFETKGLVSIFVCYQTPYARCFPALDDQGIQRREGRSVPWRYSVKMTIIRAGTTVAGLAISDSGVVGSSIEPGDLVGDFVSLSGYDPDRPPAPDRVVDGITFSDGNFVSASSPIYLSITSVNPGTPNLLQILPTTPNVPPTFDFTLNAGDTVIVEARKQALAEAPPFTPGFQDVKLAASLAISGVPVATQGSPTSSADNKAGFTFSFTVQ